MRQLCSFANRRILSIFCLYIASGLPLVLTGSTLQAWYTMEGLDLKTIGILTLVGQPYAYKFLWAPLFDRFVPMNIGRRRSWIFLMQLCLCVTLSIMAVLEPDKTPWLLAAVALAVACFSASQDIVIDAYRTDLLPPEERGMGAAMVSMGYRVAILISGALALVMAQEIGWRNTYLIMAGIMLVEMFITLWAPNPVDEMRAPSTLKEAVIAPFREFMSRPNAVALLIFIIIYKLCDAFALSLNTTFLLRGVGFGLVAVGTISKTVSLVALVLGGLIGGIWLPRLGLYLSLMYFGLAQMASNLMFALLAIVGKNYTIMAVSLFVENFCGGLATVAFVVLLTSLCNKRYTATQYALFSALTSIGRVFAGPVAAAMVESVGWVQFYVWTFAMGLPSLLLLWWLQRRVDFSAEQIAGV